MTGAYCIIPTAIGPGGGYKTVTIFREIVMLPKLAALSALDIDHNKHVIGTYGCYKVISQLIYI